MTAERHLDDASLLALLAGDLDASDAANAQAHVSSCRACERSLAAFREVHGALRAAREEPTPFASARMQRALGEALAGRRARPPRLVRRSRAVVAVAVAALSGAALAMTAVRASWAPEEPAPVTTSRRSEGPSSVVTADEATPTPMAPIALIRREALVQAPARTPGSEAEEPAELDAPEIDAARAAPAPLPSTAPPPPARTQPPRVRVAVAPGTPSPAEALERAWSDALSSTGDTDWVALGDAFAQAGALERAADAWVRGLSSRDGETAAQRLWTVAREGLLPPTALLARLDDASDGADVLRLRCEWGLRYRGDRDAVKACQAFGRAYPAHPAVRALALAAGQLAETRLADLELAVAEYSRAIMVSEYAGIPSSEALLSRARARAKLGDREEAQADLRLYLHVAPEAYNRADIRALAESLGVPAP